MKGGLLKGIMTNMNGNCVTGYSCADAKDATLSLPVMEDPADKELSSNARWTWINPPTWRYLFLGGIPNPHHPGLLQNILVNDAVIFQEILRYF